MQEQPSELRAEAMEIWRGDRCLFGGLDLRLCPGQLALVTGANGSGKTTLLRALAGLSAPTAGRATWRGGDVMRMPPEARAEIAYHGHLEGLSKHLTVTENLRFYRALWRSRVPIEPLLGELNLQAAASLQARQLSAGQRRRLGLATLRFRPARLWILDEPATNLDEAGRSIAVRWLEAHLHGGGLAVVATHQPHELARRGAVLVEL
jgi:heme exporter protein A